MGSERAPRRRQQAIVLLGGKACGHLPLSSPLASSPTRAGMHIVTAEFPHRWLTARLGSPLAKHTDCATSYFAPWWVINSYHVCPGWEIDYSTARCGATADPRVKHGYSYCFEGVIVKDLVNHQVWRLTGKIDESGWFEGRWPD